VVGSARSLYRYSILGLAMLVPDRLCLALWPVLSGALSVVRRLWSLMRLHGQDRRTSSYSRRLGRVIFQEGIRVHSLALEMLARDGFAAIWVLHLLAARAYREGRKAAATAIIEIADAAEREWLRRGTDRLKSAHPLHKWTGDPF
jgi:hypothetical protein